MRKAKSYAGSCFCGAVRFTVTGELRLKDGLPKLKDVPKEVGGSRAAVPE